MNVQVSNENPVDDQLYGLIRCLFPMMRTRPPRERDNALTWDARVHVSASADRLPDGVRMWVILGHTHFVPVV
jgi:hypothetical protein